MQRHAGGGGEGELRQPPFGSTDIIECSIGAEVGVPATVPPFGSTDIIECSLPPVDGIRCVLVPPFGSTDIIECSFLPLKGKDFLDLAAIR